MTAAKHGLSSMGLHDTATSAHRVSPENAAAATTMSDSTALKAAYENLFIFVIIVDGGNICRTWIGNLV